METQLPSSSGHYCQITPQSCKSIQMKTWHLELQQLFYNHEAMNSTVKSQCSRNSEAEDALGLQELPTSRPGS